VYTWGGRFKGGYDLVGVVAGTCIANAEIFCGCLSSKTVKSLALKPGMNFPEWSVTITSSSTNREVA
jgi:hypothetical protein